MPTPIMFKLRVVNPTTKNAALRNAAHVGYIGSRPGVAYNEGHSQGLFGKFGGLEPGDVSDLQGAKSYVLRKTRAQTPMYRCVLSFTEDEAARIGLAKRADWERLLRDNLPAIAEKLGIPPSRLEYVAALHLEEGHPHLHLMLWDRNPPKKTAFIKPALANELRGTLIKNVYKDEMAENTAIKNAARDSLLSEGKFLYEDVFRTIAGMSEADMAQAVRGVEADPARAKGGLMNTRMNPRYLRELGARVAKVIDDLPKTGALKYAYLPEDTKATLREIVEDVLDTNPDFSAEMARYRKAARDLASYYASDPDKLDKAVSKAEDDITKRLCNQLLRGMKKIRQEERQREREERTREYQQYLGMRICLDLFGFFSSHTNALQNQSYLRSGELSKQAKKEKALEHRDSAEWGPEMD